MRTFSAFYDKIHSLKSEAGTESVSFAIIIPLLLALIIISIDLGRIGSSKDLLSRACSNAAYKATATWPVLAKNSGDVKLKNIFCDPTNGHASIKISPKAYYKKKHTKICGSPRYEGYELLAMASAAQQICSSHSAAGVTAMPDGGEPSFLLPKDFKDCTGDYECAYVYTSSCPNNTKGILELTCGMTVKLFSSPLLALFGGGNVTSNGKWKVEVVAKERLSR